MTDSNFHNQNFLQAHRHANNPLLNGSTYGGIVDCKIENSVRFYNVKWIGPSGPSYIWMSSSELFLYQEDSKVFNLGNNSQPSSSHNYNTSLVSNSNISQPFYPTTSQQNFQHSSVTTPHSNISFPFRPFPIQRPLNTPGFCSNNYQIPQVFSRNFKKPYSISASHLTSPNRSNPLNNYGFTRARPNPLGPFIMPPAGIPLAYSNSTNSFPPSPLKSHNIPMAFKSEKLSSEEMQPKQNGLPFNHLTTNSIVKENKTLNLVSDHIEIKHQVTKVQSPIKNDFSLHNSKQFLNDLPLFSDKNFNLKDVNEKIQEIFKKFSQYRDLSTEDQKTISVFLHLKSQTQGTDALLFTMIHKALNSLPDADIIENCYQVIISSFNPSIKKSKLEIDNYIQSLSQSLSKKDDVSETLPSLLVPRLVWGKPQICITSSYRPTSALPLKYKRAVVIDKKATAHGGVNFIINTKNHTVNVSNVSSLTPIIDSLETFEHKRLEKMHSLY